MRPSDKQDESKPDHVEETAIASRRTAKQFPWISRTLRRHSNGNEALVLSYCGAKNST
jgi:hypothetical protein